ncbi:hypothetical protein [Isoptericola croceus]|uniref:hypothetical protein n=1 Tax=Isoptericola croceus TaxID=3031406 RepID=UPI0023F8F3A4|nr:hypothetical protein [Isoptericola croceus]
MPVRVHPRIQQRHPEIEPADVVAAFEGTLRKVSRTDTDPLQWVGVGMDGRGRLLEYVAIEVGIDDWLVFHAMAASTKTMTETGLRRK